MQNNNTSGSVSLIVFVGFYLFFIPISMFNVKSRNKDIKIRGKL